MSAGLVEIIRLRADPELRTALADAAKAQRVSMSEIVRRQLRMALSSAASRQGQGRAVHHG